MAASSPLPVTASTTSAISRQVLKVPLDISVAEVIHRMSSEAHQTKTSCAIVVDDKDAVIGILTERDIVRLTASQAEASYEAPQNEIPKPFAAIPVSAVMTSPVKTLDIDAFQDIFAVLFLFRRYRIRHLPIVTATGELIGVVTPTSIRTVLKPANLLKVRRVADIMTDEVVQASADAPVIYLAQLMAQHRVSCVVIVDTIIIEEDGEPAINPPIGIVTERDIVQFQALGLNLQTIAARKVMSSPLFLMEPQDSLWAAHEAMQTHKVRRLVVSWNWGKGIGIITQTSLLRVFDPIEMYSIIDSLQQTIKQLSQDTKQDNETAQTAAELTSERATEASARVLELSSSVSSSQLNPSLAPTAQLLQQKKLEENKLEEEGTQRAANPQVLALLAQATSCLQEVCDSEKGNKEPQPQLHKALQLIQQVRDTL